MSVAKTYSKALLETASEGRSGTDVAALCSEIETQLDAVLASIRSSKDLQTALYSPVTTAKEKASLIRALADRVAPNKLVGNFLVLLASKRRFSILPEIREEFSAVRLIAEGGVPGRLVSAEAMNPSDVDGLAAAFGKKFGKKVAFRVSTDPALLAGMKVTVSGVTYDGTLRSQIQRMRDRLLVGGV